MIIDKFGKVSYDGYTIPNLFVNLGLTWNTVKSMFVRRQYTITGSPRPEQLAYMLYGDSNYEWVLLLINGVIDPWHGWIRPDDVVRAYAEKKYADFGGANGIHHYVDPLTGDEYYDVVPDYETPNKYDGAHNYDGSIAFGSTGTSDPNKTRWYNTLDIDKLYVQFIGYLVPITNVEFELDQNEKMRQINIIRPEDLRAFVDIFERTQNGRS